MKRSVLKLILKGSAIVLLPLSIGLWLLLATFVAGVAVITLLGVVHPEVLPESAQTVMPLIVTLLFFLLFGIPTCAFWTHVAVSLWKKFWPEKFWFTKAACPSLWDHFINLPLR